MSAFDKSVTADQTTQEQIESYLEKLVAEKGEQWKDPEVIAKGKYEADRFIKQLEEQNRSLREDLDKAARLDEMLEVLKKSQGKASEGGEGSRNPLQNTEGHTDDSVTSDEKVRALIEAQMKEHEAKTTYEKNVKEVDAELVRRFGDSAANVVARKAAELEMTVQEAELLAASKPKAFFRLMGLDVDNKSSPTLSGSAVRSEAREVGGQARDWNYYNKIRRESKSKYYSPSVQKQMYRDMQALGDKFGLPR